MKKIKLLSMVAVVAATVGFASCSKKSENLPPTITKVEVSSDNKTATVTFSEPVYGDASAKTGLTKTSLNVVISGVTFTYTVNQTPGSTSATINLAITSIVDAGTVVKVSANANSVFDVDGLAMVANEPVSSQALGVDLGIVGKWKSEGANVAPLLVTYFKVSYIIAEFKKDKTYIVQQFNTGNTTTTPDLTFTGTYEISKSAVGNIWNIDIAQQQPSTATAKGIFEIKTNPEVLWYEVVQTSGTQNVAPTPEKGFGSSNNGTLGTINIQKYVRM